MIRTRSRRASITGPEATPSTSTGRSRRSSPVQEASPTLAPDPTTQLSYDLEDSYSFRAISAPTSELMGTLGALTGAGPTNHVGDTTHRALYQTPSSSSPYNLPFSSVDSVDIDPAPSPFKPYKLDPESTGALAPWADDFVTNTQHIRSSESSHKRNSESAYDLPNTEAGENADGGGRARHPGLNPCPDDNLDSSDGEP
jgi:hypothetical protein